MSFAQPWRLSRLVAPALAAGAAGVVVSAVLAPVTAHAATLTGTITVSSPSNAKVAADTPKQVINLTVGGTGAPTLTEDNVASVSLGACTGLTSYVVTSATTISVKTPAATSGPPATTGGCAASGSTAGDIVITMANGDTLTKTAGITFVNPPAIATTANKPVINDNSAALTTANQANRFGTGGGQTVRVKSDGTFIFDQRSAAGLAASLGGKAGTNIKVYADMTSTTPLTATSAVSSTPNSFSFTTTSGMTAGDASLSVTQDGVTKTFSTALTGASVVTAPVVTSLNPNSGRAGATGSTTVITGANLPKVLGDAQDNNKWLVKFCGVAVPAGTTGGVTAANAAGTSLTVTVPDVTGAQTGGGLGTGNYAGACAVTVTDVVNSQTSAITPGSYFTVISE